MEAKKMQIEFERRIQLISPDLIADNKPNSDTIFSYLNAAQDRYMIINYLTDDQTANDTNAFKKSVDAIKSLFVEKQLLPSGHTELGFTKFKLPSNSDDEYFLYVESLSEVTNTYKQTGPAVIANRLVKYTELQKYVNTAFNSPIIRQPAAALMSDITTKYQYLVVATDKYTNISNLILHYYRKPLRFSTTGSNKYCELPDSACNEIIDMAVDMFIIEGKYKLQTKSSNNNQ